VVAALLESSAAPGIYQIADDESLATADIVRILAESAGKRARIWRLPVSWVRAVARLGDHLHLPLNSERLKKLTEIYEVANAKVKNALGWERMPVSAREGLQKTAASFSE